MKSRYLFCVCMFLTISCQREGPDYALDVPSIPILVHESDQVQYYPLVAVDIDGYESEFILDTGATRHGIWESVVWYLGLDLRDHTFLYDGEEKTYKRLHRNALRLTSPGSPKVRTPVLVVDDMGPYPLGFEYPLGFLGAFSPQMLIEEGSDDVVVIDFPSGVLWMPDGEEDDDSPELSFIATKDLRCRESIEPENRLYYVDGFVGAGESRGEKIRFLVDTGTSSTFIFSNNPVGQRFLKLIDESGDTTPGHSVVGVDSIYKARQAKARIQVGDFEFQGKLSFTPSPRGDCFEDGILGMDVLRYCRLEIGASEMKAFCDRNAQSKAQRFEAKREAPNLTLVSFESEPACGLPPEAFKIENELPADLRDPAEAFLIIRRFEKHAEALAQDCHKQGFFEAEVIEPITLLDREKNEVSARIFIEEGPRYTIGKVQVAEIFSPNLRREIKSKKILSIFSDFSEKQYSSSDLIKGEDSLMSLYSSYGSRVVIEQVRSVHKRKNTVDLEIRACFWPEKQHWDSDFERQCQKAEISEFENLSDKISPAMSGLRLGCFEITEERIKSRMKFLKSLSMPIDRDGAIKSLEVSNAIKVLAEDLRLFVGETVVQNALKNVYKMNGIQTEEEFRQHLDNEGVNFENYKEYLREEILKMKVFNSAMPGKGAEEFEPFLKKIVENAKKTRVEYHDGHCYSLPPL